jgi:hypothetical protein
MGRKSAAYLIASSLEPARWALPMMRRRRGMIGRLSGLVLSAFGVLLMSVAAAGADDSQAAWAALASGGHIALIRHGNAPPGYGGDPPGFVWSVSSALALKGPSQFLYVP